MAVPRPRKLRRKRSYTSDVKTESSHFRDPEMFPPILRGRYGAFSQTITGGQIRWRKMRAVDAAVLVLEREGVTIAFGVPGAAINPLYAAMRNNGSIRHILARHVEGASHMADGYTRAKRRKHRRVHRHLRARPAPT